MGWVRSEECSSKVVGLSSDGKSNKLCTLVVSPRFGHGGVNGFVSLRPPCVKKFCFRRLSTLQTGAE